jgi:hypothetical protein
MKNLNELIERLEQIRDKNIERGWSERNEIPVFVAVDKGKTPTGRIRRRIYAPVADHVSSSMVGGIYGDGIMVINCDIEIKYLDHYIIDSVNHVISKHLADDANWYTKEPLSNVVYWVREEMISRKMDQVSVDKWKELDQKILHYIRKNQSVRYISQYIGVNHVVFDRSPRDYKAREKKADIHPKTDPTKRIAHDDGTTTIVHNDGGMIGVRPSDDEIAADMAIVVVTEYVGGGIVCPECGNHNALLDHADYDEKYWPRHDGFPIWYLECRDCHYRICKKDVQIVVMDGEGQAPNRVYKEVKRIDHDQRGWSIKVDN